jgi:hypothetical protein
VPIVTEQLYAGTQAAFAGSMAEAMEKAMDTLIQSEGKPGLPMADTVERKDRRRLFIAIAAGVINHLAARDGSIEVTVHHGGGNDETVGAVIHVQAAPPASPGAP